MLSDTVSRRRAVGGQAGCSSWRMDLGLAFLGERRGHEPVRVGDEFWKPGRWFVAAERAFDREAETGRS